MSRSPRSRRGRSRLLLVAGIGIGVGLSPALSSCGWSGGTARPARAPDSTARGGSAPLATSGSLTPSSATTPSPPPRSAAPAPSTLAPGRPLQGKVVGIDPGHNGLNYSDSAFLGQQVFNGRSREDCDTTGTQTAGGYTEAEFNFNVAQYVSTDLESEGAQIVLTRSTNSGVGPCVDRRAQILNAAHADVAIDIHADGGPPNGRGFAILEPIADGPNDAVIHSSQVLGTDVKASFESVTGMPTSSYDGTDGIAYRDDLAGLNLTAIPKVLIECGNMQNATDAALLQTPAFQHSAARALAVAITNFLTS